jgi:hypothetical protein
LGLFFVQIEIAIGIEIVLAVAFANVQRYRLARAQPLISLISGRPMDAIEDPGRFVHPGDVVDRKAVDVKLFVPKCHFFSISIAIPISIWIVQRSRSGAWRGFMRQAPAPQGWASFRHLDATPWDAKRKQTMPCCFHMGIRGKRE